jgi:hypothetical protein
MLVITVVTQVMRNNVVICRSEWRHKMQETSGTLSPNQIDCASRESTELGKRYCNLETVLV